jgi:DNA-directed RNA polymerase specialized sigma24 family protein
MDAEAEEVTQEVFVRVHGALASFRGDAKFGSTASRSTRRSTSKRASDIDRHTSPSIL